jgi:hypothetical protein
MRDSASTLLSPHINALKHQQEILMVEENIKAVEEALAKVQEKKKAVVIDNIVAHCNESSSFEDLRTIG